MSYTDLAKELKKHTEILETTFFKNNLQIISFNYRTYPGNDADCSLLIEFSTIDGTEIPESVHIKVNLYNDNNEIYLTNNTFISSKEFSGYDTIDISLYDSQRTLLNAKSGRIFVTK